MLSVLGLGTAECEAKDPSAGSLVLRVLVLGAGGIIKSVRSRDTALEEWFFISNLKNYLF